MRNVQSTLPTLLLSRRKKETAMELRLFWLLSDLLENKPNANELRRGGFCGGNDGSVIFIPLSVSSSACSSISTNDGIETLAQSFFRRYFPLSMALILYGGNSQYQVDTLCYVFRVK